MCESRAQFRSTRLWTLNDWVDTAARHNGGDAITICHKASRVWTLSFAWMHQITFRKKNCYQAKIHSNLWSMSCQSNHSQDIPPNVLHKLSRMPRTWSESARKLLPCFSWLHSIKTKTERENQENRWSFCGLRFFGRHARTTVNLLRVQFKRSWPCVVSDEFSRIHPSVESAFGIISINKKVVRISHLFDSSFQLHFI